MKRNTESYAAAGRQITLHHAQNPESPLVLLNAYTGDGGEELALLEALHVPDFHLLVVSGLDWERDLSPWPCPALLKGEPPFAGEGEQYLQWLTHELLPEAKTRIGGRPAFTAIAGYSLAGLFALYALYRCDAFDRSASISGSLWYPKFREFAEHHQMKKCPERLYLSLGDRESKTRNPLMKTVEEQTLALAEHYRQQGLSVKWELNPGNHFRDEALRTAKGIAHLLEESAKPVPN